MIWDLWQKPSRSVSAVLFHLKGQRDFTCSSSFSMFLTFSMSLCGRVFFKMDTCSSTENRGFLVRYCLPVRYLEVAAMVTPLYGSSLSPFSILTLSVTSGVEHLLLCSSLRFNFQRWRHPFTSIAQKETCLSWGTQEPWNNTRKKQSTWESIERIIQRRVKLELLVLSYPTEVLAKKSFPLLGYRMSFVQQIMMQIICCWKFAEHRAIKKPKVPIVQGSVQLFFWTHAQKSSDKSKQLIFC